MNIKPKKKKKNMKITGSKHEQKQTRENEDWHKLEKNIEIQP